VGQAEISVDAVLYEADIPLKQLIEAEGRRHLAAGNARRRAGVGTLRSVILTEGRMGRVAIAVAIRVTKQLRKPNTPSRCSRRQTSKPSCGGTMSHSLELRSRAWWDLLLLTIGYCMLLNSAEAPERGRASLKADIGELITATESPSAPSRLKHTVRDVNEISRQPS